MCPHPSVNMHPSFHLLLQYATKGCPTNCSPNWSIKHIEAAIKQGNNPSACTPEAAAALWAEALEKVANRFARLVSTLGFHQGQTTTKSQGIAPCCCPPQEPPLLHHLGFIVPDLVSWHLHAQHQLCHNPPHPYMCHEMPWQGPPMPHSCHGLCLARKRLCFLPNGISRMASGILS